MSDQIHHAVSSDGTRIAGRVSGRGPPLVLAHGGAGVSALALRVMEQAPESEAPSPNDPDELARVAVPVLLARGSDTTPGHARSITRLAEELPRGEVREIPGAGHLAPAMEPEPVAQEFIRFLEGQA
jgi:pimeloyl-ACP methyl ester carboxylesterase